MRVGFAAIWEDPPEPTWSYIPWNLRAALARAADVVDVGFTFSSWEENALKALHLRRLTGRTRSTWRHSRAVAALAARRFERAARDVGADVVLETTPIASPRRTPYFVYHDAGVDALEAHRDPRTGDHPFLPGVPRRAVERIRDHQREVFAAAAGVFAFSEWLARSLVDNTGIDPGRVIVVPPGRNAAHPPPSDPHERSRPGARRNRLLFVGKVFAPKGGDVVLGALDVLRREHDPETTLTIAGPPLPPVTPLPPGVRFVGRVPVSEVAALYAAHDVFVMPSRIEPFGIVFAEALAHGLPCVARNAFAMPEIVHPGARGALVDDDDPNALAAAVAGVLTDDALFARVEAERAEIVAHYSWDRAARQMLEAMGR